MSKSSTGVYDSNPGGRNICALLGTTNNPNYVRNNNTETVPWQFTYATGTEISVTK